MTETDNLSRLRGVGQSEDSPGRPPGRPMRQLEFHQAMSDFRHMFPETDEEVIEAVLRANNGMVDATIDQLLTMNIDAGLNDDDDLSDHILMSVERDVQQSQQLQPPQGSKRHGRESKSSKKGLMTESLEKSSKDTEDCPPSYTEAVQSHMSHNHRSSSGRNRHHHSPTLALGNGGSHHPRHTMGTMQHLLDLGPDTAPVASAASSGTALKTHHSHHHSSVHHHTYHHHTSRSSNHHRRRGETIDGSPHKPRPGRNILSTSALPTHAQQDAMTEDFSFRPQRKGSLDSNDFVMDNGPSYPIEKSPHRWRSNNKESQSTCKRPVYRNWNPPLLGTLPDDFLRITPVPVQPPKPPRPNVQLHRTMSAVGPQRPVFYSAATAEASSLILADPSSTTILGQATKQKSSQKPHRSLSFAGNTSQIRRSQNSHPSGLAQHEFSSDILQERMKENERRRRLTSMDLDPDLAQYLEDERLAIMLQNSEFLQELRGDRMFMLTLERDQHATPHSTQRTAVEPPVETITPSSIEPDNRDFIEGYGDDKRETLETFPFSQQLPPPVSEDVELRKKLKNMGKASRKQFAALAKKFFLKRKKKSAQQILKESQAPSMMNLLDEEEDEEEEDQTTMADNNGASDSFTSSYNHQSSSTSGTWGSQQKRRFDIV